MLTGTGNVVWLASYPKSGNTWLRAMLTALCAGDGRTPDLDSLIGAFDFNERQFLDDICAVSSADLKPDQLAPYVRTMRLTAGSERRGLTFVKTHDRFTRTSGGLPLFPAEVTRIAVCIVRNPLDVAVSFAAHNGSTLDAAIDRMCNQAYALNADHGTSNEFLPVDLGDWSGNVASWLDQADLPLLLVRYEDMLENPADVLRLVADMAGLQADRDTLADAVLACSFGRLKAAETTAGFREKPAGMKAFFRQGRAGDGVRSLSKAQVNRLVDAHGKTMRRCGYLAD